MREYAERTGSALRKKNGKLTILENKIEVIRDGNVLNNDQLIKQIRVPDKIQRKFTIARDYEEQTRSCERLAVKKQKQPFVVSNIPPPDEKSKR